MNYEELNPAQKLLLRYCAQRKMTGFEITGRATATAAAVQTAPEEYVAPYTQNATGESEIVKLANTIRDQRVILVESDVTAAQEKAKRVRVESTW